MIARILNAVFWAAIGFLVAGLAGAVICVLAYASGAIAELWGRR